MTDSVPATFTFLAANEAKRSLKLRADVHNGFIEELNAAMISFAVSRSIFTLFGYGIFSLGGGTLWKNPVPEATFDGGYIREKTAINTRALPYGWRPDNRSFQDCCLLPTVPHFETNFSLVTK